MKSFKTVLLESLDEEGRCWSGFKPVPGKKPYSKGSCVKEDELLEDDIIFEGEELEEESEYQGKKVTLNKPFRTPGGPKKFSVYVKNDKGNVIKVNFGDPEMRIKKHIPQRRKSFRARHKCDQQKDRTSAAYWSCKAW